MPRYMTVSSVLALAVSSLASAQGRPMSPVDLIEVPAVIEAQLSSNGRQVLYVLERPDWKVNRRVGHIWRINADGTGALQLTFGERGETSPRWSPDGQSIAFLARRGESEETQIFLLENNGGEARQLTKQSAAVANIGREIVYSTVSGRDPDGREAPSQLWAVNLGTGARRRIAEADAVDPKVSPDGRFVAFWALPVDASGTQFAGANRDVWLQPNAGGPRVQITRN